jgi:hypothetical protein
LKHNTEFTPKLCTTCRCKNGIIECSDSCTNEGEDESLLLASSLSSATSSSNDIDTEIDESSSVRIIHMSASSSSSSSHHQQQRQLKTRTNQNEATIKANHRNRINNDVVISQTALKGVCFHDGKLRQYNSTWSPVKCTQCRCALNSVVDCYVFECPLLNCSTVCVCI